MLILHILQIELGKSYRQTNERAASKDGLAVRVVLVPESSSVSADWVAIDADVRYGCSGGVRSVVDLEPCRTGIGKIAKRCKHD